MTFKSYCVHFEEFGTISGWGKSPPKVGWRCLLPHFPVLSMISTLNKKSWKALLSLHLVQSEQCESASQRLCNNNNNASSTMSHQRIHFCSYEKRWQAVPATLVVELSKGATLGCSKLLLTKGEGTWVPANARWQHHYCIIRAKRNMYLRNHIPAATGLHCRETLVYWLHTIWKSFSSMMML